MFSKDWLMFDVASASQVMIENQIIHVTPRSAGLTPD